MSVKTGKYRHFKGREYAVYAVAEHSETGESMVVYSPLYGDGGLWVRPLSMFEETVEKDGLKQPRFQFLEALADGAGPFPLSSQPG